MYCTILPAGLARFPAPLSGGPVFGLAEDAGAAYHRFRRNARLLGSISHSFELLTQSMTGAYFAALTKPSPQAWMTLVTRTALLVARVRELDGIVSLDANEREARDFFTAIVRENSDLLAGAGALAAGIAADPRQLPAMWRA
jgi:hypothetical protein